MREKIDELRDLLDLQDREVVSMTYLEGIASIPDPDTHEMTYKYVRTGDIAIVFVGPKDKLDGVIRENKEDGTRTFELTFPASSNGAEEAGDVEG